MNFVNLTPHEINIINEDTKITVPPSDRGIARVEMTEVEGEPIEGVPVIHIEPGSISGLPAPEVDTIFIVSAIVAMAANNFTYRPDVVAPDTGATAIRNEEGQIQAVTRFVSHAPVHFP